MKKKNSFRDNGDEEIIITVKTRSSYGKNKIMARHKHL